MRTGPAVSPPRSRTRSGRRWIGIPLALVACLSIAGGAVAEEVDLEGSWYVLIHYKDDHGGDPDQDRWDDRLWIFESKGRRLSWTEYPIVVFEDESGRFERRHTGQYARILHAWEPDGAQRANIAAGLQVNTRGSKTKTLRGSDAKGWASGRRRSAGSASVVTYQEVWSVEGTPDLPIFRRADFMGSDGGRTDTMEGLTEYATTKVRQRGDLLEGTFERDGTRHGTFKMMRSGGAKSLGPGSSQQERQQQAFRRSVAASPQIRAQAAQDVKEGLDASGIFLGAADLDLLAGDVVLWSMDGVPPQEMRRRLGERMIRDYWSFLPKGASHDDGVLYRFPFDPATARPLLLGAGGEGAEALGADGGSGQFEALARHGGWAQQSFKFGMPEGSTIRAARGGEVARVVDGFEPEAGQDLGGNPNGVWVLHEDGTAAFYLHLADRIPVRPGQRVEAGQELGRSGKPGYADAPLLHFMVIRVDEGGAPHSVGIRFDDGSEAGVTPQVGYSYPGGRPSS
jgi:murein DD-endopeptidase MepM/ murein hydrolase activator NlpD